MRLFLLSFFIIFSFLLTSISSQTSSYNPNSRIEFKTSSINFKEVFRGEILTASFEFTNKGSDPLVIQGIHSSCGCIVSDFKQDTVYQPNETSVLNIKIDTSNFSGNFHKNITLITNNKKIRNTTLSIKAFIKEEIRLNPPLFDFEEIESNQIPVSTTATLSYLPSIEVKDIEYNKDIFDLSITSLDTSKEKDTKKTKYNSSSLSKHSTIKLVLKKANDSSFIKENLLIHTSSKYLPKLSVPIRASILSNIVLSKKFIEFGGIAYDDKVSRTINIKTKDSSSFKIKSFKILSSIPKQIPNKKLEELIDINIKNKNNSFKDYDIDIDLKNTIGKKINVHGKIILNLDTTEKGIELNFYGLFI